MNLKISIFFISLIFLIACGGGDSDKKVDATPKKPAESKTASSSSSSSNTTPPPELIHLDQGWNKTNKFRELSYYTNQGSRLIPYKWFLALEQPDNDTLFRDSKHIESLGFLTHSPQPEEDLETYAHLNPDGLPVGFVKDPSFVKGKNGEDKEGSMGFNCSACHTGEVHYKGNIYRIDGAPAMADLQTFLEKMSQSLQETLKDDAKFNRFAEKVQGSGLKEELKKFSESFSALVDRNKTPVRYGLARLDAFGSILNAVAHSSGKEITWNPDAKKLGVSLKDPIISNAPVSYPFIWDAPHLDWVQWNSAVDNPISRNAGEVIGVYGEITRKTNSDGTYTYSSSGRLKELFLLEDWLKVLKSPKWSETNLPGIEPEEMKKGLVVYNETCKGCHSLPTTDKRWPIEPADVRMTNPKENFAGKSFIVTTVVSSIEIGTDLNMAKNFALRFIDKTPAAGFLSNFVGKTIYPQLNKFNFQDFSEYTGYRYKRDDCAKHKGFNCEADDPISPSKKHGFMAYKARPLNGIWATAPYLHNGSVPNLAQLILLDKRSDKFCVGSKEFDAAKVGFVSDINDCKHFTFDTSKSGNSNAGHNYAKDLDTDERKNLLAFLKSL